MLYTVTCLAYPIRIILFESVNVNSVNWISAYNRLFSLWDRTGTPTYCSGGEFLRMAQQVDPGIPSYQQLIPIRQSQGKSTSRKSYYWDIIQGMPEQQRGGRQLGAQAGPDILEVAWRVVEQAAVGRIRQRVGVAGVA